MVRGDVEDGVLGKHLTHGVGPLLPCTGAPEVIDPQEAAFEEVVAQPLDFNRREADRSNVRPDQERAFEQRVVSQVDGPVLGVAVRVLR